MKTIMVELAEKIQSLYYRYEDWMDAHIPQLVVVADVVVASAVLFVLLGK